MKRRKKKGNDTEEKGDDEIKKNALSMEEAMANAEHQIDLLKYGVDLNRHKKYNYVYDTSTPIMNHGLGRRRLVKAVEMFEELHDKVCEFVVNMNDNDVHSFVESPSVYVLRELYQRSNENIKQRLKTKLGPILQRTRQQCSEDKLNNLKGLAGLIKEVLD